MNTFPRPSRLARPLAAAALTLAVLLLADAGLGAPLPANPPAQLSRAEIEGLFDQGNALFRKGLEAAKTDPSAAKVRFGEAAATWRTIATAGGIRNAQLETNIANASLLAGETARAIAAFRRAVALDPQDRVARNGLAAARRAAGTEALSAGGNPSGGAGSDGGLGGTIARIGRWLAWAADRTSENLPPRLLLAAGATCYLAAFGIGAARALGAWGRAPRGLAMCLGVFSVLCFGPLVARDIAARSVAEGVVIQAGTFARSGPAEMYDPAFKETLAPGLEVRIIERRAGWVQIRLADGRTAWAPEASLESL